jgi:hypothetical protein
MHWRKRSNIGRHSTAQKTKDCATRSPTINLGELRKIYTDNASLSTWVNSEKIYTDNALLSTWVNSEKYTQTMHHYQPGWTQKNIPRQCIISCMRTGLTMVSILKSSMYRQVSDIWKAVTPHLISKCSLTRTHDIKLSHFSHIHSK